MSNIRSLLNICYLILLSRHASGQAAGRREAMQLRKLGKGYSSPWMEEILDDKKEMEYYWSHSEDKSLSMSWSMSYPIHTHGKKRKLKA